MFYSVYREPVECLLPQYYLFNNLRFFLNFLYLWNTKNWSYGSLCNISTYFVRDFFQFTRQANYLNPTVHFKLEAIQYKFIHGYKYPWKALIVFSTVLFSVVHNLLWLNWHSFTERFSKIFRRAFIVLGRYE